MLCSAVGIVNGSVGQRRDDVRRMLLEQQRQLLHAIRSGVQDARNAGSNSQHHSTDPHETAEADAEDDLVFALIQMRAETLERINEAVRHVDEGTYGYCVDCGDVIAPPRLRAMPFAVRCRDCEEARENERHRECVQLQQASSRLGARF